MEIAFLEAKIIRNRLAIIQRFDYITFFVILFMIAYENIINAMPRRFPQRPFCYCLNMSVGTLSLYHHFISLTSSQPSPVQLALCKE